jgi:hypothetical protein
MSGTGYAAAGVAIIIIGDVLNNKKLDMKKVVGGTVATLGIAALDSVNDMLSTRFGQLFLVGVAFIYAVPLLQNLGVVNKTGTTP